MTSCTKRHTHFEEFEDKEDMEVMSLVYTGLFGSQMENKLLLEAIRNKTIELIERGADLAHWEDSKEADLEDRKRVLNEFKQHLIN